MILQSVAWARMLVDYSRSFGVQTAIEQTFDGQHPCEMCKMIQKARQSSQQELQQPDARREPSFCETDCPVGFELPWSWTIEADEFVPPSRNEPPPVPPPRDLSRRVG